MAVTAEELEIVVRANIQDALSKMEELKNKLNNTLSSKISNSNGNFSVVEKSVSKAVNVSTDRLGILSKEIDMQKNKIRQLAIEWKALTAGKSSISEGEAIKTFEKYQKANIQLEKMMLRYNDISNKTKQVGKDSEETFENIKVKSEKASKSVFNLGKMFKRIIVLMAIRGTIRQAIEGFNDLAKYSAKFNTSMSNIQSSLLQVRNSLSTAFAPIVQALEPVLTRVASLISEVFTNITMYTTALFTNSKTYTKAKKVTTDYAKSLGSVADAQKKVTASFDEFNVLNQQSSSSSSSGLPSFADMFEEVAIPSDVLSNAEKIKEIWEDLKPVLLTLAAAFAGLKIADETTKLGKWIKKMFGATDATDGLNNSMLNKNETLGEQTKKTEDETVALKNLLPQLAGAGAGAWAFKEAMEHAKGSVPSEMPSIDTNSFNEKVEGARETVYAFQQELETDMPKIQNDTQTAIDKAGQKVGELVPTFQTTEQGAKTSLDNMDSNVVTWGNSTSENFGKVGTNVETTMSSAFASADETSVEFMNNSSKNVVTWGTNLVENIGKTMKSWYETFTSALKSAWDAFAEFMGATGKKISNWWSGAKDWVIPTALTIGAALVVTSAVATGGATLPLLALADGGVMTQPTPALVGEYAGARTNPEIVTPQNIMYETVLKANVPVMNAIEEMTDVLVETIKGVNVYAEFGYDKLKVGLDNETKRTGNKLYNV